MAGGNGGNRGMCAPVPPSHGAMSVPADDRPRIRGRLSVGEPRGITKADVAGSWDGAEEWGLLGISGVEDGRVGKQNLSWS